MKSLRLIYDVFSKDTELWIATLLACGIVVSDSCLLEGLVGVLPPAVRYRNFSQHIGGNCLDLFTTKCSHHRRCGRSQIMRNHHSAERQKTLYYNRGKKMIEREHSKIPNPNGQELRATDFTKATPGGFSSTRRRIHVLVAASGIFHTGRHDECSFPRNYYCLIFPYNLTSFRKHVTVGGLFAFRGVW